MAALQRLLLLQTISSALLLILVAPPPQSFMVLAFIRFKPNPIQSLNIEAIKSDVRTFTPGNLGTPSVEVLEEQPPLPGTTLVNSSYLLDLLYRDGDNLIVGGRDAFYNLSASDLHIQREVIWSDNFISMTETMKNDCLATSAHNAARTRDIDRQLDCRNYIRLVYPQNESLVICGSFYTMPKCIELKYKLENEKYEYMKNSDLKYSEFAPDFAPSRPRSFWTTSTIVSNEGMLFVAANIFKTDNSFVRVPAYARYDEPSSSGVYIKGTQSDYSLSLAMFSEKVTFASQIELDDRIFMFFNEEALERKAPKAPNSFDMASRVGAICKTDNGVILPDDVIKYFASPTKATLSCQLSPIVNDDQNDDEDFGKKTLSFYNIKATTDFMSSVYGDDIIYSVFTTEDSGSGASAVCAHRKSTIMSAFGGNFRDHGVNDDVSWNYEKYGDHPSKCSNITDKTKLKDRFDFLMQQNFALMTTEIKPVSLQPLIVSTDTEDVFRSISVTPKVRGVDGKEYDMIHIGTENGKLLKYVSGDSTKSFPTFRSSESGYMHYEVRSRMVSQIQLNSPMSVNKLTVFNPKQQGLQKIIAFQNNFVVSLPGATCATEKSCKACVALRDPLCAWSKSMERCQSFNDSIQSNSGDGNLIQNTITGESSDCPPPRVHTRSTTTDKPPPKTVPSPKHSNSVPMAAKQQQDDSSQIKISGIVFGTLIVLLVVFSVIFGFIVSYCLIRHNHRKAAVNRMDSRSSSESSSTTVDLKPVHNETGSSTAPFKPINGQPMNGELTIDSSGRKSNYKKSQSRTSDLSGTMIRNDIKRPYPESTLPTKREYV